VHAAHRTGHLIAVTALTVLVLVAYGSMLSGALIPLDTEHYVLNHPRVNEGLSLANVLWAMTSFDVSNWHPVTWLSYMLDVSLFGVAPAAMLGHNLLIHLLSTALLYALLWRMTGSLWCAAAVAALFAVHPLNVENVAWVAQRKTLEATFWFLLSGHAYVSHCRSGGRRAYLVCWLCYAVSLMAKPMMVTLPFLFLLWDLWPLNRLEIAAPGRTIRRALALFIEKLPFLFTAIGSSILTVMAQGAAGAIQSQEGLSLGERLANVVTAYVVYLSDLFFPHDLAVYYPLTHEPRATAAVMGAILLLIAISSVAFRLVRKAPFLFVGWFTFIGTLVPMIGLVQVGDMSHADRYVYVPAIGIFIAVVWGLARLCRTPSTRRIAAALGVAAVLAATMVTRHQVGFWDSPEALYRHTLEVAPDNPIIQTELGTVLMSRGETAEAERHLSSAGENGDRTYVPALIQLALLYRVAGRCDEALRVLDRIAELEPMNPTAYNAMAEIHRDRDDTSREIEALSRVVRLTPTNLDALFALTRLVAASSPAFARLILEDAVRANPGAAEIHREIGVLHVREGSEREAIRAYHRAIAIDPRVPETYYYLGRLYADMGNISAARECFEKEVARDRNHAESLYALATIYLLDKEPNRAFPFLVAATVADPELVPAHLELAFLRFDRGDLRGAAGSVATVLRLDPSHVSGRLLDAQISLAEDAPDDAADRTRRLLAEGHETPNIYLVHARATRASGQLEDARAAYTRLIELRPDSIEGRLGLASLLSEDNTPASLQRASALAEAVVAQTNSRDAQALTVLSRVLERTGDDALPVARKALALARAQNRAELVAELEARIQRLDPPP